MQANFTQKIYKNRYTLTAIFFIAVGAIVRVVEFGNLPAGFNQDEAFAAYEAFSLLNYGVDSAGNANPTYFISWGSGMNVLESYLAIPFMWIFGDSEAVFRLPQLICGIISMPVLWLVLKRLFNNKIAIVGLFIMAISPWHIMLSRFGLESNLAPAFLLFGLFFLLKGIQKNTYFLLSAFFYGISLYAYSIIWLVLPIMILIFGIYVIKYGQGKIKIVWVLVSCFILFLFAIPHILFLLINSDVIPEIKTSFLTIPKLVVMRGNEISILNIFKMDCWKNLLKVLFLQYDGIPWNTFPEFGLFYHISIPFFIIGFIRLVVSMISDIKSKKLGGAYFVVFGFIISVLICLMIQSLNINKSNCLHLFTLMIIAVGICSAIDFCVHKRVAIISIFTVFCLCFTMFCGYYFGSGKKALSLGFAEGIEEAVEFVNQKNCEKVSVDRYIYHSFILYYDKTSPKEFNASVKYEIYPHPYLRATAFDKYFFETDYNDLGDYDAYIFPKDHLYFFDDEEFEKIIFNEFAVAIRR